MELENIMKTVFRMREALAKTHTYNSIEKEFSEFKSQCPKLFEMVLENQNGYMEELQKMVIYAKRVKSGEATMEEATKVVKHSFDNRYIYPIVDTTKLNREQLTETQEYVLCQQMEVDRLEKKWSKGYSNNTEEDEEN
jgi:hypothetical protein